MNEISEWISPGNHSKCELIAYQRCAKGQPSQQPGLVRKFRKKERIGFPAHFGSLVWVGSTPCPPGARRVVCGWVFGTSVWLGFGSIKWKLFLGKGGSLFSVHTQGGIDGRHFPCFPHFPRRSIPDDAPTPPPIPALLAASLPPSPAPTVARLPHPTRTRPRRPHSCPATGCNESVGFAQVNRGVQTPPWDPGWGGWAPRNEKIFLPER